MYRKKTQIITSIENLSNYIDGFDIYNSLIIDKISDPSLKKEDYEITVYQYRPDLIAKEFYGTSKYLGLLMLQCGMGLSDYVKGRVLRLIPKATLDNIIGNI